MDLLIVVGDQDTYHEDDPEIADSPIWVADSLSQAGIRALFVVQSRWAEILAEQGRGDVIAAVRRHEVALHGRDIHPVIPEVVEGLGWHDGVEALSATETAELALLGRVFDVAPVAMSEHRGFGAAQVFVVARRLGIPYLFGFPSAPPAYSVSWYAGVLNVPFDSPVPGFLGFFPAVFDNVLHDDDAFAALLGRLRDHVGRCLAAGLPLLVVFLCHPERLCYAGPVERWQYGNGQNRGRGAVPPGVGTPRTRSQVERALANLGALVRYLRDAPGLEPTTVADVQRRYGHQARLLARAELAHAAARAVGEREVVVGGIASPAETLLGWAESLVHFTADGELPEAVARRDALGPTEVPPLVPEALHVDGAQVGALARNLLAETLRTGHLPAALSVGGRCVGLGALYGQLAEAYLAAGRGVVVDDASLQVWPRYPALAVPLGERFGRCAEDPLVRPGLSTDALARHARLQSWTLKPAVRT